MIVQHSRLLCPGGDGNIQSQRREKPYGKQNIRRIQTMTNKAKTYLKNIQEADTEKKLKQILFFRTKAEMDAYHDMSRKPEIGRRQRSSSREAAFAASGRSSRKRRRSMNTRLGRKPTPTHNSTQKVHAPKRGCASYPICF